MKNKVETIEIVDITKIFDATIAIKDFSAKMERGNIYGIVGENGAGKSTLMKILNGALCPDTGDIIINGHKVRFSSPKEACDHGIGMVYQELNMLPNLSVTENVYVSHLTKSKSGYINWKILREQTIGFLKQLNVNIDPDAIVGDLKVAHQQVVAIIRALALNCSVLILDEPTSALTMNDAKSLLTVVTKLKELGYIVIYISHKLDEILSVTDQIIALRNGENIGVFESRMTSQRELVELVAGRKLENKFPKERFVVGEELLRFENVSLPNGLLNNISFTLRKGSVLGFAGLLGAGKTEIAQVLFGIYGPNYSGKIYLKGKLYHPTDPLAAIKNGIGLVPENRAREGLIVEQSIYTNTILTSMNKFSKGGRINFSKSKKIIGKYIEELRIKCGDLENPVKSLSGGNQQKVVLAKWLAAESSIIIFDEPTRGIDVGAKVEVYNVINSLVGNGIGVMLMSSENDEVFNMSDQVIALSEGRIVTTLDTTQSSESDLQNVM